MKIARNGDVFVVDRLKVGRYPLPNSRSSQHRYQEILKVRGFQVAPAELEGHLLDHPDVADTCVVGIPDDYSGEVPLAFVTLEARAAERVKTNIQEAEKLKQSIAQVSRRILEFTHLRLIQPIALPPAAARLRCESAIQVAEGWRGVRRHHTEEPERKTPPAVFAR